MHDHEGVTILLATHNGAATLPQVLDAYTELESGGTDWHVVVIDNASNDATPDILNSYTSKLPLQNVRTERRGKNIALNIGLEYLRGALTVFTDDDTLPAVDWLYQLKQAADQNPDFDLFGGQIDPLWPFDPPEWIPRLVNLGATFGLTPDGLDSGPVHASRIWGANMAVRTRIFEKGYRFNEHVGPTQGSYIMGSEVEFNSRLEADGYRSWFCKDARVRHIIRQQQLERSWIIGRAFRLGRHMFHQEHQHIGPEVRRFLGAPRWQYRRMVETVLSAVGARIRGDFDDTFKADWQLSFLRGYLGEAKRHAAN